MDDRATVLAESGTDAVSAPAARANGVAPIELPTVRGVALKPAAGESDVLRAFLAARPSMCPACHYELGRIAEPRCPECGAMLRLVLVAKRSAREAMSGRLWLMGLIGPCTALGVLTLELSRVMINYWAGLTTWVGPAAWMLWNRGLLLAGAFLLLYLFIGMRDTMTRQHPGVAMLVAQAAWVLAVVLLGVNQYVFV